MKRTNDLMVFPHFGIAVDAHLFVVYTQPDFLQSLLLGKRFNGISTLSKKIEAAKYSQS